MHGERERDFLINDRWCNLFLAKANSIKRGGLFYQNLQEIIPFSD